MVMPDTAGRLPFREQIEPLTFITENDLNEIFVFHKPGASEKSDGYVSGFNLGMAEGPSLYDFFGEAGLSEKYPPDEMICFGRLDQDTSGLIVLARRGKYPKFLDQLLLNPYFKKTGERISKVYQAAVKGIIDPEILRSLRVISIPVENGAMAEVTIENIFVLKTIQEPLRHASTVAQIEISEGRYHQVKKMFYAMGHPVRHGGLHRIRLGNLNLDNLARGEIRNLLPVEKNWLTSIYNEWLADRRAEHHL